MTRSIFISRDLPENSSLLAYLENNGWTVHSSSLIRIEPIDFKIERDYDWIFLSSSNGAKILFHSYQLPEHTKLGVVGQATAKTVKSFGLFPDFVCETGNMDELGDLLARTIGSNTVLFAGAKGGSEKVRWAIPEAQQDFIPVYETVLRDDVEIPETEVVFLTSPSNANNYLKSNSLNGKIAIAIGQTTAGFLRENGVKNVLIPRTPKEEDLIDLIGSL